MQRIGIFYKDKQWATELYNQMLARIPQESLEEVIKNRLYYRYKDKTDVQFIYATDHCQQRRYDIILIQNGVSKKLFKNVIQFCIVPYNIESPIFIVETIDDIKNKTLKARDYYSKKD